MPGIVREFGQSGIKRGERELLTANADEIETLLTMLKSRDDWQGREMAWHLQWLLLKAAGAEAFDRAAPSKQQAHPFTRPRALDLKVLRTAEFTERMW